MHSSLTPAQLADLRAIDTPTVCNAIEKFGVRGRIEGFLGMDIRCLTPELGTMLGYAVTVTVDSTTPDVPRDEVAWRKWLEAMAASPRPGVLVFKDVGSNVTKSAHLGEVMGTIARRLGMTGVVCDGGIRDIWELKRLGFHCFAAGLVPSHGNPRLIEVNVPVTLDGVTIRPGDLLHGDANGVTVIPGEVAERVAEAVGEVRRAEAETLAYANSAEFTLEGIIERTVRH